MTTFMSSGPVLLCTESSIFLASLDLDGLCIAPSIFAKDSGTGIRGYSNTFWRSKSDMALRYNSRPRRSLLPVISMIFSLSCDLTSLLTASLVNVFSFRLGIGFWKRSSSLRHSSLHSSHHVRPIATQLTRSSLTSTLTFLPVLRQYRLSVAGSLNGFMVLVIPCIILCMSSLSFLMRCVSNSLLASDVCFKPADAMRFPTMLLRTARVIIRRFHAESEFVKEDTPVRRDAASAFTVCSSVISTGVLENDVDVRRTENAPPCSTKPKMCIINV